MVAHRRIGPDTAFLREFTDVRKRVQHLETRPSGNIVIRDTLTTTDPETGVSTQLGVLPDGSIGFQPFIGDITPPPVATQPVVSAQPGMFTVSWDGLFVNNEEKPRDFEHVNVIGHKMDGTTTVLSLVAGVLRLPTDTVFVAQDIAGIGETWQFSLESEDFNGNLAVRGARSASLVMESVISDQGVTDALEAIQQDADAAAAAAVTAQGAAQAAQEDADAAAQAAIDAANLAEGKGVVYTQPTAPALDFSGLWINTAEGNKAYIAKNYPDSIVEDFEDSSLILTTGVGSTNFTRQASSAKVGTTGYRHAAVTSHQHNVTTETYGVDPDTTYEVWVRLESEGTHMGGIVLCADASNTFGYQIFIDARRGTGSSSAFQIRKDVSGTTLANMSLSAGHPIVGQWYRVTAQLLSTGVSGKVYDASGTLMGELSSTDTTYTSGRVGIYGYNYVSYDEFKISRPADAWLPVQDYAIISAASAAASAQNRADQAFNSAVSAAEAAGEAQDTADGKNKSWYTDTAPAGTGHNVGDMWFDTNDGYKLSTWTGTIWQTTQDAALAKLTADSKGITYTQSVTPPVEARLPQNLWNDTSLGLNNIVVKYWDGNAWTALADKTATDARVVADAKGEVIYSDTEPAVAKRLPQNLWIDTSSALNLNKRWINNAWTVVVDSRIPATAAAVTAAQQTADAKSVVYTQSVTPPVEARLPQTLWNDTSLGLTNVVVKYWDGDSWEPLADKVATDAALSAGYAQAATAYNTNPSFDDWPSTVPTGFVTWSSTVYTKDTVNKRVGPYSLQMTAPADADLRGIQFTSTGILAHAPNLEYFTVEVDFTLISGTGIGGAGLLLDWTGLTPNRTSWGFSSTITGPLTLGKMYRVSKTLRRPTGTTGTWTSMTGFLMANYGSNLGTLTAKSIAFDWLNIRPATTEEITAYGAPGKYTELEAATAAKGKVIYSTSAPAVGDRLSQNLWVDTTGGINIHKRWDGNDWIIVADSRIASSAVAVTAAQNRADDAFDLATDKRATYYQDAEPTGGTYVQGDLWIDTNDGNKLYAYDGAIWELARDNGITSAQASADGKNKIIYATTDATGTTDPTDGNRPYVEGDTWYKKSGTLVVGQWEFVSGAWASRKVDGVVLSNVDAGTMTVGYVAAERLKAGSIDVTKLTIADFTNLIDDPMMSTADANNIAPGWTETSNPSASSVVFDSNEKVNVYRLNGVSTEVSVLNKNLIAVTQDDKFYLSCRNYSTLNNTGLVRVSFYTETMTFVSLIDLTIPAAASAWATRGIDINTIPATAKWMRISLIISASNTSGYILFASPTLRRKNGGELIVDGAINGKTITGAIIQTEVTASRGIKLTATELAGYDGAGVKNFSLSSAGVLAVKGTISSGSTISGATLSGAGIETSTTAARGVKLTNTGITTYDASGNMTFKVDATTGLVQAPGLEANSIKGDMIAAKTIGVDKLMVQDFSNYVENPGFETGDLKGWDVVGGWSANTAAPHAGAYKALTQYTGATQSITNKAEVSLPVDGKVRVKFRLYSEAPTSGVQVGLALYNSSDGLLESVTNIPTTTGQWVEIDRELTAVTAGTKRLQIFTTGAGTGYVRLDSIVMNRMMNGELIVDGAINGKTITGATIQTETTASRGIKLTTAGLTGYDSAGVANFSLTSAGVLSVRGSIEAGTTITAATITGSTGIQTSTGATSGVKIRNTGIIAYDGSNNMTFKVDATTGLVEAPGLKANSITGNMIAADTITAKNIAIGDFTNVAYGGAFNDVNDVANWTLGTGVTYTTTAPHAGVGCLQSAAGTGTRTALMTSLVGVRPGDQFTIEFYYKTTSDVNGTSGNSKFRIGDQIGTHLLSLAFNTVATSWTLISNTYTVPASGVTDLQFQLSWDHTVGTVWIDSLVVRKKVGATLIENGAITTVHMTSNTIDAAVISTGTLTGAKIASKSITVDKLVVTSTDNLVVEADFGNGGASWELSANKTINATAGQGSLPAFRVTGTVATQTSLNLVNKVSIGSEDRFRGSLWVRSTAALTAGKVLLKAKAYTTATAFTNITIASNDLLVANTWTNVAGISPVLATGVIALEFFIEVTNNATGTITDIGYVGVTRAADGKLVVDGAIDGKTITGALFQTDNTPLDSSSSRGIKLNSSGLKAYDPTGLKTFEIDALTGEVSSSGTFQTSTSEYVEGSGTMEIGAIFGNLTYVSHTEYTGIPGIKFTRTHSSEGEKAPATIMYDGSRIRLSTYDPDSLGFVPNSAGGYLQVGEGTIDMGAGRNGATYTGTVPVPSFTLHGGTVEGPGYENITLTMGSKPAADYMKVGLEIENYKYYGTYSESNPFTVALVNRSDQYTPTQLGSSTFAAHDGGRWEITGKRHSDGVIQSRISVDPQNVGGTELGTVSVYGTQRINLTAPTVYTYGTMDAASYLIGGVPMSNGETQVWDTINEIVQPATIPVPRIQGFTYNATDSTVSNIATASTGYLTITTTGIYDLHWSYGQSGPTNADRNFLEVKTDGQTIPLARSSFANGEDSASTSFTGVRLTAGQKLYFEIYEYGVDRFFTSKIRIKRVASPTPTTGFQSGNITHAGDLTVQGNFTQKIRHFKSNLSTSYPPNATNWGPGIFTRDAAKSINDEFVSFPTNDQIKFLETGVYSINLNIWDMDTLYTNSRVLLQNGARTVTYAACGKPNGDLWEMSINLSNYYATANETMSVVYHQNSGHTMQFDCMLRITKLQ